MNKCGVILLFGAICVAISFFAFAISPWLGWIVALCCVAFLGLLWSAETLPNAERSGVTNDSNEEFDQEANKPLVTEQKCLDCEEVKSHTEFARHGTSKTGLRKSCISCVELAYWKEEFAHEVYTYGLDRTSCTWCSSTLVIMANESICHAFKICPGYHASYSRMVSYRLGYERADRSIPRGEHHGRCYIARGFPQLSNPTNVIEELSSKCRWPKKIPDRVHFMVEDRGILCGFKYKNMSAEYRTAVVDQVTCKRCTKNLP